MKLKILLILLCTALTTGLNCSEISSIAQLEQKAEKLKQAIQQNYNKLITEHGDGFKKVISSARKFEQKIVTAHIDPDKFAEEQDEDETLETPSVMVFRREEIIKKFPTFMSTTIIPSRELFIILLLQLELAQTEAQIYRTKYESKIQGKQQ